MAATVVTFFVCTFLGAVVSQLSGLAVVRHLRNEIVEAVKRASLGHLIDEHAGSHGTQDDRLG